MTLPTTSSSPAGLLSLVSLALLISGTAPASGAVFSVGWNSGFADGGLIPDGNATGWSDVRSFNLPPGETIVDVDAQLSFTGSWNGDIYAYLTHPNLPEVVVLLNRPGRTALDPFGYNDGQLNITLDDTATLGEIHSYQGTVGYTTLTSNNSAWKPDGRAVSPLVVNGTEARTATLSLLNGVDATSGNWTLFVADLSTGTQATVTRWGLTITTIPEPATAHLLLGFGLTLVATARRKQVPTAA